jgi:MFS family permease
VLGACVGALFFGQLCDRFGRKKLFLITLGVYIASTVVTAFSFAPWFFYLARFFTGSGIGGEYAAINSAIDELIPARVRGRVDLIINGSYWAGSAAGSAAALLFLDTAIFAENVGWRLAFGIGALLGLAMMLVRRKVPESPRWLFIHGREEEAEAIVGGIEQELEQETGRELPAVHDSIRVRQRTVIPFREIARVAFRTYPKRSILCLALFVGQAFLYNGLVFNLGTLLTTFYGVGAATVPVFIIIFAIGNLLGPLTLGRLFDTVGRKPMISATYLGSAVVAVVLGIVFVSVALTTASFMALIVVVFFLASAGASAAYLTASEIFPMETRALAIAFFYAIGTAVGGISGPLLFGHLIATGEKGQVAIGFFIGAAVMAVGGVAELLFGVRAAGRQLEDIAEPLTAVEPEPGGRDEPTREDAGRDEDGGRDEPTREDVGRDEASARDATRERIRARIERRHQRERSGLHRYRPGPGGFPTARVPAVASPVSEQVLDDQILSIQRALDEHGPTERQELAGLVGARYWGPGVFREALREATADGDIRRTSRNTYAPADDDNNAKQ